MKKTGAIEFARRVLVILLFIAFGVLSPESTAEIHSGLAGAR
jgi:hypothetical protein